MMKKLIIILFLGAVGLFAQNFPKTYKFDNSVKLSKISSDNPKSNTILDILIVQDTIWIATTRGLSRSTDNGDSWKNYYGVAPFGEESIPAIGYNNGVIWAATAHSEDQDNVSYPVGSGLKYSSDNGETWTKLPQSVNANDDTIVVYGVNNIRALPVTTLFNNITYDIAFTDGAIWTANFAAGVRKSTDMGQTWQRVVVPPDYLNYINPDSTYSFSLQPVAGNFGNESNLNHRAFSVVGMGANSIAVGTAGGINISLDNGKTWNKYTHQNQSNGISGNFIVGMAYNKNENALYAASWQAEDLEESYAVSRTDNFGLTWTTSLEGKKVHNFGFVGTDAIAAADENVYRSSNAGATWISPTSIYDYTKNLNIDFDKTNFYAAGSKLNNNMETDVYVGTTEGLTRMTESSAPWGGSWKIFLASGAISNEGSETYAFPNPFSPRQEAVKIKYKLTSSSNVTIRIFDFGMNLVRTLIQNVSRNSGTDLFESWNGGDENGNIVANGVYFYRIDTGSGDPLFGKIIVLK